MGTISPCLRVSVLVSCRVKTQARSEPGRLHGASRCSPASPALERTGGRSALGVLRRDT